MNEHLLTDWFPLATPPAREGKYEILISLGWGFYVIFANYRGGHWFTFDGDQPLNEISDFDPSLSRWRGRRLWVLRETNMPSENPLYVAHISKRGVLYLTSFLHAPTNSLPRSEALSFESADEAIAYSKKCRHQRHRLSVHLA